MDNSVRLSLELGNLPSSPTQEMMEINEAHPYGSLNDSLDIFNILKNEERCYRADCLNSKDLFQKSLDLHAKEVGAGETMNSFVESYNHVDRKRILHRLPQPLQITHIESDHEAGEEMPPEEPRQPAQRHPVAALPPYENLKQLLPPEMRNLLTELPKEYLQALEDLQRQPEIKSDRRRRVERYLEKRRLKTWNKKICYNCRQKVAEERLRVKGRFIGRKKAIQILGLKATGTNLGQIRVLLENQK